MKPTSDMIKDQYIGYAEIDRCPEFWHLYAYCKGLEFVLTENGSFILKDLQEVFKQSLENKV